MEPHRRLERPYAWHRNAPRVRAGGGDKRPGHDEHRAGGTDEQADRADPGGNAVAAQAPGLEDDEDAEREHREREQEVRPHEPRVQVVVDGDLPERSLCSRSREGAPCSRAQVAIAAMTRRARP